jgi:enoyl-CoA hydratase/carnithine racemase
MTQDSAPPRLTTRREHGVGWLVLSNPSRLNAITYEMWEAMADAFADFNRDPTVRVVVLTGDGDKAFASGADISQFEEKRSSETAIAAYNRVVDAATQALIDCPKPTVARIRGVCVGGGLALSLNCDLRLCSDDAVFRMPAARLGLGYAFDGILRMVEIIGAANACDLFFSARKFGAAEAHHMGLVNHVYAAGEFDRAFAAYCEVVAENAPLTVAASKRAIREATKDSEHRDLLAVAAMTARCFASRDYIEGRRAFLEKRRPNFSGE